MFKIAALVWIMLATTMAGISLLVIVTVPQLADDAQSLIPIVGLTAMVIAMPLSYVIARRISDATAS